MKSRLQYLNEAVHGSGLCRSHQSLNLCPGEVLCLDGQISQVDICCQ